VALADAIESLVADPDRRRQMALLGRSLASRLRWSVAGEAIASAIEADVDRAQAAASTSR
jgi:hypothetical protein